MIDSDLARLPHALLIMGKVDALEQELSQDLKALLCETKQGKVCNVCPSCQLFDSEAGHPDLMMLRPEGKLNVIKIDSVREVISFLEQTSLRGGRRIVVFVGADTLNIASQNALLKSLEEPGSHTLIILLTAKPHLLLPTIRSRCQVLQVEQRSQEHDQHLMTTLLAANFDPLRFIETHKDLDPLECVHTEMRLIHNMMQANPEPRLAHFYRDLATKSALLQKKVAINAELSLFELALAWKRLISDNISH